MRGVRDEARGIKVILDLHLLLMSTPKIFRSEIRNLEPDTLLSCVMITTTRRNAGEMMPIQGTSKPTPGYFQPGNSSLFQTSLKKMEIHYEPAPSQSFDFAGHFAFQFTSA